MRFNRLQGRSKAHAKYFVMMGRTARTRPRAANIGPGAVYKFLGEVPASLPNIMAETE